MYPQKSLKIPKLDNVPLINLRFDFRSTLTLFRDQRFRNQFPHAENGEIRPIVTNFYTWHGMPNILLTHILRDSIVGLESAVSGAVLCEAMDRGTVPPQIIAATKDPFSLKEGGTVASVYHALPTLIDNKFSLKLANPELWGRVQQFYREVRNPIFHSSQISEHNPDSTWRCLELIWEIYQWLNSWHSLEKVGGGMVSWSKETLADPSFVPVLSDVQSRRLFPERLLLATAADYSADKTYSLMNIKNVKGIYLDTVDRVDISLIGSDGEKIVAAMPPFEAMRLLNLLGQAKNARGWQIPDINDAP